MIRLISYLLFAFFTVASTSVSAIESKKKHLAETGQQVGFRLGAWNNLGDSHPDSLSSQGAQLRTKINNASFYFEGFYSIPFSSNLRGELSLGIVNRGTISFTDGSLNDIGNLLIYPIFVNLKFYPLSGGSSKLRPYFSAGLGIVYAKQSIQFSNDIFFAQYRESSKTKFSYTLNGGFDWLVGGSVGFELNAKYLPVNFSEPFLTVNNYDSFSITIGVKYFYKPKKEESRRKKHPRGN